MLLGDMLSWLQVSGYVGGRHIFLAVARSIIQAVFWAFGVKMVYLIWAIRKSDIQNGHERVKRELRFTDMLLDL